MLAPYTLLTLTTGRPEGWSGDGGGGGGGGGFGKAIRWNSLSAGVGAGGGVAPSRPARGYVGAL